MATQRLGVVIVGDRVTLSVGELDVRIDAEGARTIASMPLAAADIADAVADDDVEEPTAPGRGLA